MEAGHLFCLESDYKDPELRAFALVAQQLREPLAKAMIGTELLLPNAAVKEDAEATKHLAQVNRSLHQLLRAVCNMSDAAQYADSLCANLQAKNATEIFDEILKKAADLAVQAGRTLLFTVPKQAVFCPVDEEKLERAILNLLSNAIKFTPKGGTINAIVQTRGNRLLFTVHDSGEDADIFGMFSRFLREPGIEDGRSGIGLGMSIVHSVAAAHGGTVLIERLEKAGVKITMTLSLKQPDNNIFRSPVRLPIDYAGGYDHCLLELSDILPDALFLENM
jgi:K+-sensing histidine kinase KdpD